MSITVMSAAVLRWLSFALFGLAVILAALLRIKRSISKIARRGEFDRALRMDRLFRWLPGYGGSLDGMILFTAGRYPEAQEALRPRAFDKHGQPRFHSNDFYIYTLALVNDARELEALPLLEAATRAPQQTGRFRVALATCLLSLEKEPERARELLEQAMKSRPEQSRTYGQRADDIRRIAGYAWALASCGRRGEAEPRVAEALAGSIGFKSYDFGGVQYYVGETWRVLGETQKSQKSLEEALALCPEGAVATSVRRALAKLRRR